MHNETAPCLIAIDWGTSNFRAFLLNSSGTLLAKRFARQGILKVRTGNFAQVLNEQIGDWVYDNPALPVLMSGMIGSRQGWQEASYLQCPVPLAQLAENLQPVQQGQKQFWIVPGLRIDYNDDRVDVMRGEETQMIGALAQDKNAQQIFCLPGTHSKWAWVDNGKLVEFTTFMTGELFTLLAQYSILGKLMHGTRTDFAAFMRGIEWSRREGELLSKLFQVRTQVLSAKLANTAVHSFLSGLLIGCELNQVLTKPISGTEVVIIANARVAKLYAHALKQQNINAQVADADQVTANGLLKIAKLADLVASK